MPFLLNSMGAEPRHNYTAVIYVQIGAALGPNAALYKLVRTITKSQFVERVSLDSPYCYGDKPLDIHICTDIRTAKSGLIDYG